MAGDVFTGIFGSGTLEGDQNRTSNLGSSGDFSSGLSGWIVNNPTSCDAPKDSECAVRFGEGNKSSCGDLIEQSFNATTAQVHTVSLGWLEGVGSTANHTFQIDNLANVGGIVAKVTYIVTNASTTSVSLRIKKPRQNHLRNDASRLTTNTAHSFLKLGRLTISRSASLRGSSFSKCRNPK